MTPEYLTDVNASFQSTEIGLNVQSASPPTQAYVGLDDSLWVMAATQNSGLVVTVNARLLMPDGTIKLNQWALRFAQSRLGTYQQITLPECFLLSIGAVTNSTGTSIGTPFVTISLSRLSPSLFNAAQQLCGGYCQANQPVTWPGGINSTSVDSAGAPLVVAAVAPGAGNNLSMTVPTNAKWRPIGLQFTFTASATVASRTMVIVLDDGLNQFMTAANPTAITAGQVATVSVMTTVGINTAASLIVPIFMFLGVLLMGGFRIRTAILNLQAGDTITSVALLVEEWITP